MFTVASGLDSMIVDEQQIMVKFAAHCVMLRKPVTRVEFSMTLAKPHCVSASSSQRNRHRPSRRVRCVRCARPRSRQQALSDRTALVVVLVR
jgi:hypothetical protein